jgi:hypothetical protein
MEIFFAFFTGFVRNLQGDFCGGPGHINTGLLKILKIRRDSVSMQMFIVMYIGVPGATVLRTGNI